MENNIIELFKNTDDYFMIFSTIFRNRSDLEYFKQVIEIIIDKCLYYVMDYEDFLESLLMQFDNEEIDAYMTNRYLEIIPKLNPANLMYLKANNNIEQQIINDTLNYNEYNSIYQILTHQCFENLRINADDNDKNYYTKLLLNILKSEKKLVSDIEYKSGLYSNVYVIGDKVFKIGRRKTFKINYYKRYLKPILRYEQLFGNEKIVIELTNRVDMNTITYSDLKLINKELKMKNLQWDDDSLDNIGRLIYPNVCNLNYPLVVDETYKQVHKISNDNGYILNNDFNISLPAGEIVIIDNDYVYENKKNYIYENKK